VQVIEAGVALRVEPGQEGDEPGREVPNCCAPRQTGGRIDEGPGSGSRSSQLCKTHRWRTETAALPYVEADVD
jgi:hypothetical protein